MAKLTKFTISPSGELVYKSTGKLAPEGYKFRKNTVYGPNGRRIGTLSRKLTKTEATKIAKAERSRTRRTARAAKGAKGANAPKQPSQGKPKKPSKTGAPISQQYGDDWSQFDDTDFPEYSEAVKEEFAARVRLAAEAVAPPWLSQRIRALSTAALWQAWQEDQYIFETFFRYHEGRTEPVRSDVSVWLYQFVTRIEQYMGVKI